MPKKSFINLWKDINKQMWTQKLSIVSLSVLVLIQSVIICMMYFSDPIVVVQNNEMQNYYIASKTKITISEDAVKQFVKKFLSLRYEWQELQPDLIKKNIEPIVTQGLSEKIYSRLNRIKTHEFKEKKAQQSITNVEVEVTKEKVLAKFDKLLKIDGIPLPIPTTISLNIIRDSSTVWNPIGLLVNGVIEHQSK